MPAKARPESERVRLARLALVAALNVPGVREADAGPTRTHFTAAGDAGRLDGVRCLAVGDGYAVELRLVCEPTPLRVLAEQVRDAVGKAASAAQLAPALATVDVTFSDIATESTR